MQLSSKAPTLGTNTATSRRHSDADIDDDREPQYYYENDGILTQHTE